MISNALRSQHRELATPVSTVFSFPWEQPVTVENSVIASAINSRHQLEFVYRRESQTVEPYCCGVGKDNRGLLSAWQIYGQSPGWHRFHVADMVGLRDNGKVFQPGRAGYTPDDSAMQSVDAHI
jgi:hypothetical protein